MNIDASVLKHNERAIFALRELYSGYGYAQYKMSKFEEYDLYVRNKEFLVSDNIITFTDKSGRLMALKPDVTLSIIKSSDKPLADGGVYKVYYDENVYRVSGDTDAFKEIPQAGLVCIGDVDDYNIYEVLMLALRSLATVSDSFVLDVSDLDVIAAVMDPMGLADADKAEVMKCIGEKNAHGVKAVCERAGVPADKLIRLVTSYGAPSKVIPVLREILPEDSMCLADRFEKITSAIESEGFAGRINIDFSVTGSVKYYNGYVFKGFVDGISSGILSGGQYDRLMARMHRTSRAIGFAMYLDLLERLTIDSGEYDVDCVLLYDEECSIDALRDAVNMLKLGGKSVTAIKQIPDKMKYRQLLRLNERGVQILENNA
ncbi:MAG: ATP phosphoribosyltransferase regulatory subunit [Clostridia bacterium]|nr:ATP phosphoribosyltransferase regulatory subunit [Clostridia bacterium]